MLHLYRIDEEQVAQLDAVKLTQLLRELLRLEASNHGIMIREIFASLEITVPDGGEDGSISWANGPDQTPMLPCRLTGFQIKSSEMGPKDCAKEVLAGNNDLKPRVNDLFERAGAYVLFKNKNKLNHDQIIERQEAIRNVLRRLKKGYAETALIKIYDCNLITQWVNQYPQAVFYVWYLVRAFQNHLFRSLEIYLRKDTKGLTIPYIRNPYLTNLIAAIRDRASEPHSVVRLTGLSGLGKSRLIVEALQSDPQLAVEALFLNAGHYDRDSELLKDIEDLSNTEARCVLVVENCSAARHQSIVDATRGAPISLITNHYEPERDTLLLDPKKLEDVIPMIVRQQFTMLSDAEVDKITSFSRGFPSVAVILSQKVQNRESNLGIITEKDVVSRLLGISLEDKDRYSAAITCAMFTKFGFDEEMAEQRNAIASNRQLFKNTLVNETQMRDLFYEVCRHLVGRGILERQGRFLFMKPTPLALTLAAEWWDKTREEEIPGVLVAVDKIRLTEEFCEQLKKLDEYLHVKLAVARLCGDPVSFGNAEVLNSQMGSRLFRAISEVNPEVAVETLTRVFADVPLPELKPATQGRRNLVWALEKLCFRKDTFGRAVKILARFAAAENEDHISNNATGQLIGLFQMYLPGTQASLQERLAIIDWMLSHQESEIRHLAVDSLGRGLKTGHFTRSGGAEDQGSGVPLKDYEPDLHKGEAINYVKEIITRLENIANANDDISEKARSTIIESIFELSHSGLHDFILPTVKLIASKLLDTSRLREVLLNVSSHDRARIGSQGIEEIDRLLMSIEPRDFPEIYRVRVACPVWEHRTDEDPLEIRQKNARKVADTLINEVLDWRAHVPLFCTGVQQEGWIFGQQLHELMVESERDELIDSMLEVMRSLPHEKRNLSVLQGMLSQSSTARQRVLKKVISDADLCRTAFQIVANLAEEITEVAPLFGLVEGGLAKPTDFSPFVYGKIGERFSSDQLSEIVSRIAHYEPEGPGLAISMLFNAAFKKEARWTDLAKTARGVLLKHNLFQARREQLMDDYLWTETMKKCLKQDDPELATVLMSQIVEACGQDGDIWLSHSIETVFPILIEKHFDAIWPTLSNVLLATEAELIAYSNLSLLIGAQIHGTKIEKGYIALGKLPQILEWCQSNKPLGPVRIAQLAPMFEGEGDTATWHPLTKALIDEFGDSADVLHKLSSSFVNAMMFGSWIPQLELKKRLFRELLDHKHEAVRQWSRDSIEEIDKKIKKETYREEERW